MIKSEVIAQNDNYYLDNPQANITPSEIVISGQLRKPIRSQVTINGSLVVENKNLSYKVSSIQAGKLEVPRVFSQGLESLIGRLVTTRLSNPNIEYQSVVADKSSLTITGIKK